MNIVKVTRNSAEATTRRHPAVTALLEEIAALDERSIQQKMLPAGCYTSSDFFAFEQREVFSRQWICVGRVEQIAAPGDWLSAEVAGEPIIVNRTESGTLHAMSAVCQHRGEVIPCPVEPRKRTLRCPLHFWTYDLSGRLTGAPHIGDVAKLRELRERISLPSVRIEEWHGFLFVNLTADAPPVAPSLSKLEPFWQNYEQADLVSIPPAPSETPLPWNWKVHVENFTDAYHPEFVHRGTHDFAPSIHPDGGVRFTEWATGDNAIARSVPLVRPDGGMMDEGWGEPAMFPPIITLAPEQRRRLTFALLPPSLTLVFAPGAIAYTMLKPKGVEATFAASDRVTGGGWLLPRSTIDLSDFAERVIKVRSGAAKIWAQDVPVNRAMQAGKYSRYHPPGIYGPLEITLQQFNLWLLRVYQEALRG